MKLIGAVSIASIGALTFFLNGSGAYAAHAETVTVQAALVGQPSESQETNLGDLVADAVRQTGKADFAMVAADEISDVQIPAGSVSVDQLLKGLQYANDSTDTVVVLSLEGSEVIAAAERSVSRAPLPFDGFLQLSGLQIQYSPAHPEGKRIMLAGTAGSEVVASKTYRVATTRPIAFGSFGYFKVWNKKDIIQDTGVSVAKSLADYLTTHKVISGAADNRIVQH